MERLSEDELAHMTPAEREGYELMMAEEDGDQEEDGSEFDGEAEDEDNNDSGAAAGDDDDYSEQEQDQEGQQPNDDNDTPAQAVEAEAQAANDDELQFPEEAQRAVTELSGKIEQNEKQQEALLEQFDDGELTRDEYAEKLAELRKENQQFTKEQAKAEQKVEDAIDAYRADVRGFLADHAQYKPGGLLHKTLDERVKELQSKSSNPLSPKIIRLAHQQIQEELGIAKPPAPKTPDGGEKGKAKAGDKPKPKREMPPNLNALPSAEVNDATDDDGHFAVLARLAKSDPQEHERRLQRMSDTEMDAYLRYGG